MKVAETVSCPACGHLLSHIYRTERADRVDVRVVETYRRRECQGCGHRFTTHAVERVIAPRAEFSFSMQFTSIRDPRLST